MLLSFFSFCSINNHKCKGFCFRVFPEHKKKNYYSLLYKELTNKHKRGFFQKLHLNFQNNAIDFRFLRELPRNGG
jgi:hypothetical protein